MKVDLKIYKIIKDSGIDFITSVPCQLLKEILKIIDDKNEIIYLPVTREEEGVGIAAGAYLGGKKPAVLMQNSGLGNSINAITSLLQYYEIPVIFFISHRGGEEEPISSHIPMGKITETLLGDITTKYWNISSNKDMSQIKTAINYSNENKVSVAILLKRSLWSE
ncbi:MAG: sulfopyruvate decarboxylase subunit alpha [Candidatus Lokiarchaeota archaeon]|nr:sulfopyruvate decarboxylase subunit alpha [Candidatus Lokiarchaeota archaeon]